MGEAKRRKLAGTYPRPDDPLEKLRRFLCGRSDAGPVEEFRAPEGTVAITADVQGLAPTTTWVFDASKLADLMADVDKAATGMDYRPMVAWLTKQFADAKRRDAFRPTAGDAMREKVSEVLRREGKAHISWHFSPTAGLAIAVGDSFADLERLAMDAPRDRVAAILKQPEGTVQQH